MNAPEGHIYRPLLWSLSALLLAGGVLLAIHMIAAVIGPFRFSDLAGFDRTLRVGLRLPGGGLVPPAARWRELLGASARLESAPSFETLDPQALGVVLLPEARALAPEDALALLRYVAAGGGVVLTGSVGVHGRDGVWRGYDVMRSLLGGLEVVALPPERAAAIQAAQRGPIAAPLLPGQRLAIRSEPGLPAALATDADLRWSGGDAEHERAPGPAASVRRRFGGGRLAWIAVGPDQGQPGAAGATPLAAVLDAALAWVARRPTLELLAWPKGAPFAATLESGSAALPFEPVAVHDALAREIEAASALSSLAQLHVPSDAIGAAEAHRLKAQTLVTLEQGGAWIATRRELSAWVRQRSSLETALRRVGPQRLMVEVTNHAGQPARDVVLRVHVNQPLARIAVKPTQILQERPGVRFHSGSESLDLMLPVLERRRSAAFTLDYEPVASG